MYTSYSIYLLCMLLLTEEFDDYKIWGGLMKLLFVDDGVQRNRDGDFGFG